MSFGVIHPPLPHASMYFPFSLPLHRDSLGVAFLGVAFLGVAFLGVAFVCSLCVSLLSMYDVHTVSGGGCK